MALFTVFNVRYHLSLVISWSDIPLERHTRKHTLRQIKGKVSLLFKNMTWEKLGVASHYVTETSDGLSRL